MRKMMTPSFDYALVTPARNEAENLQRLGACLIKQTVTPQAWIVVDDASTDSTRHVVEDLAAHHFWISVIESPGVGADAGPLETGRTSGRDIIAFNAGIAALQREPDIVVKLDADVSIADDFFERLLAEFAADPALGIAGGVCLELEKGEWRAQRVARSHVRGATRAYRWSCFHDVSPLVEQLGWDGIDEIRAALNGWRTGSIDGLFFYHHRRMGERDGMRQSWLSQGSMAWFMGYRPSYLLLRTVFRATEDPLAVVMIWGYLGAALKRHPRYEDPQVRAWLRREQGLRRLPLRAREVLGRIAR